MTLGERIDEAEKLASSAASILGVAIIKKKIGKEDLIKTAKMLKTAAELLST